MPYRLRIRFPGLVRLVSDTLALVTSVKNAILSYAPLTNWIVNGGSVTFQQGQNQSFNVAATNTTGYTAGGTYDAVSGSVLPSGLTLSSSGTLTDSGASAGTTSGVVFGYTEPGALPILTLHTGATTGTLPYMATVYPAEGAVPSGKTLASPEDSTLRASVLSAWPDGSAQVMVVAGQYTFAANNQIQPVNLRVSNTLSGSNLTPAFLAGLFSANAIQVNFGTLLTLTSTQLQNNYDRIWWQNPAVICARYRLPITNKGSMEAVIDVHAFAGGRAFVEVVIENGKVDANAATVTGPSAQTYTSATVIVNGTTIATVSSPTVGMTIPNARLSGTYSGNHEPFRAWYCSSWVGGDPLVEVTHDSASLRLHPWFYRPAEETTQNLTTKYAQSYDAYVPWATCRLRMPGMDGGGDDEQIAFLTEDQADYVLNGNKYARRAVLATGLACLSADFNWRHTDGTVPTVAQMAGKGTNPLGTWPRITTEPQWGGSNTTDGSHIPAIGLVPFLCRPSPCFIEVAQKELCWNFTNFVGGINVGISGRHRLDQIRSRAWRVRNYAFATYLTPDADSARKTAYRSMLASNAQEITEFLNISGNQILALWDSAASSSLADASSSRTGFQTSFWMMQFVVNAYIQIAASKVLQGTDASTWNAMIDSYCAVTPKYINDAVDYEWRAIPYQPTIGTASGSTITFDPSGNWHALQNAEMSGTKPTTPGPWLDLQPDDMNWANCSPWTDVSSGGNYSAIFWHALCAAVERDVPGADAAWTKVVTNGGINNLATWRTGFRTMPRWNRWPRNK